MTTQKTIAADVNKDRSISTYITTRTGAFIKDL